MSNISIHGCQALKVANKSLSACSSNISNSKTDTFKRLLVKNIESESGVACCIERSVNNVEVKPCKNWICTKNNSYFVVEKNHNLFYCRNIFLKNINGYLCNESECRVLDENMEYIKIKNSPVVNCNGCIEGKIIRRESVQEIGKYIDNDFIQYTKGEICNGKINIDCYESSNVFISDELLSMQKANTLHQIGCKILNIDKNIQKANKEILET